MATVRISKQLIEDVVSHINKMRDGDVKAEGLSKDTYTIDYKGQPSRLAEFVIWGEHYHLRSAMPQDWCSVAHAADFRFNPPGVDGDMFYITAENTSVVVPPKVTTYRPDADLTEEFIMDDANLAKFPEIKYIRIQYAKSKKVYDIIAKWADSSRNVVRFFQSKPSLNKALAEHPSLRLYVPEEYLKMVDEEVERKNASPIIDADALAAQAVAYHLRQSAGA